MRHAISTATAILLSLVSLVIAEDTIPQVVQNSINSASQLTNQKNYSGAIAEYQKIVDAYPASDYALDAQKMIAICYINAGNESSADLAMAKLNQYQSTEAVIQCFREIANQYSTQKNFSKALAINSEMLAKYPSSPQAMKLQAAITKCQFDLNDVSKFEAELNKLLTGYKDRSGYVKCAFDLTFNYIKLKNYSKALEIYRLIRQTHPEDPQTVLVQGGIVRTLLSQADIAEAEKELTILLQNYKQFPAYKESVCNVSFAFRKLKEYGKAVDIYRTILGIEGIKEAANVQTSLIRTYLEMKDFSKADEEIEVFWSKYRGDEQCFTCSKQIIDKLFNCKRTQNAIEQTKKLIESFPENPETPMLYAKLVSTYLKMKNSSLGVIASTELITKFGEHPRFFVAAENVASVFAKRKQSSTALNIYNDLLERFPNHARRVNVESAIICIYIESGAIQLANENVQRILSEYADKPQLETVANDLGVAYRNSGFYAESLKLHEFALEHARTKFNKLYALAGIAKAKIGLESDESGVTGSKVKSEIDETVQKLLSDYKDTVRLGFQVFQIGEEYYLRGKEQLKAGNREQAQKLFQIAIGMWEKNISIVPDRHYAAMANYYSALASTHMDNDILAAAFYQQVADNYPEYKKAWYAQFRVAQIFEKKAQQDGSSMDIARGAYQKLLNKFPKCSAAATATKKLNTI